VKNYVKVLKIAWPACKANTKIRCFEIRENVMDMFALGVEIASVR